jgi:hypothetical protein
MVFFSGMSTIIAGRHCLIKEFLAGVKRTAKIMMRISRSAGGNLITRKLGDRRGHG